MTTFGPRPFVSRLAIRLAIILALALLPAGFVAFVQTRALEEELATVKAALAATGLIRRRRGTVVSLASAVPYVLDNPEACSTPMRRGAAA